MWEWVVKASSVALGAVVALMVAAQFDSAASAVPSLERFAVSSMDADALAEAFPDGWAISPGHREMNVIAGQVADRESTTVNLDVDSCYLDFVIVDAHETDTTITVNLAEMVLTPVEHGRPELCRTTYELQLSEPLGNRVIVDGSDQEVVEIEDGVTDVG